MKKTSNYLRFFTLVLLINPMVSFATEMNGPILSVQADGEVKVKPDIAVISVNYVTKAKNAKAAQQQNALEVEKLKKVMSKYQITENDVQTIHYSIFPDYRWDNNKQIFIGFQVNHQLSIKIKKIEQVGEVLDQLSEQSSENNSKQIQGISYDVAKREELELKAMAAALQSARLRANTMAEFAQKKIKGVRMISDSQIQVPMPMPQTFAKSAQRAEFASDAATQISPGELSVHANVSVIFDLE